MAYIGKTPTVGNFQKCDAISVVNGQAAYTLQVGGSNVSPESPNHVLVSLNGILQAPTDSYTISGSTLTFASNLATGDVIDFVMLLGNVLDLGTPSDNTVTGAKLNNDVISAQTELASEPADTDEFLVSDAGTIKRIDYSLIKASSPGLVKLSSTTLSSTASSIDFTSSIITSTYDTYLFVGMMHPETDNAYIQVRLSDGGAFNTGGSDYAWGYVTEAGNGTSSNASDIIRMIDQQDTGTASRVACFELTLFNPQNSSVNTNLVWQSTRDDGNHSTFFGGGGRLNGEATDGIRFYFSSGDISVGSRITCYGITK